MAMPWKVSSPLDERMMFVARMQSGEKVTDLCKEFGISRKTAYKFIDRYAKHGPAGLHDVSRRPHRCPHQTPDEIKGLILNTKQEKPTWGAGKIRELLLRKNPDLKIPSRFTVHEILNRYDLVSHRRNGRRKEAPSYLQTPITTSERPNEVWCADFKGQFQMGNHRYCYPLTISDHFSRYLLTCESLEDTKGAGAQPVFESAFEEYGLPDSILTDNGSPFASGGLLGLSRLSVWWMRLGIKLRRIVPGHPEQNGRHERMHLTLKLETTRPAGGNHLQQQEKFDNFRGEFNDERPHEALEMKCPSDFYKPSGRPYPKELPELQYPLHDFAGLVRANGTLKLDRFGVHLTTALAYQSVGIREEDTGLWRVSFMDMDLGLFDGDENKFKPFSNPRQPSLGE
jgi:transposase InsO family protein